MVTNQVVVAEELQDEGNLKPQVPEEEESENDKKKPIKTAVSGEVIVHHPPHGRIDLLLSFRVSSLCSKELG